MVVLSYLIRVKKTDPFGLHTHHLSSSAATNGPLQMRRRLLYGSYSTPSKVAAGLVGVFPDDGGEDDEEDSDVGRGNGSGCICGWDEEDDVDEDDKEGFLFLNTDSTNNRGVVMMVDLQCCSILQCARALT